jgi:hypothetical protein
LKQKRIPPKTASQLIEKTDFNG